ncbi:MULTISPECIES: hypothetical protein [Ruminobacter]|uniref:hypothetical protein n=1 Tax=Ruminobacter TaxID=866 RepID=UPI003866AA6E
MGKKFSLGNEFSGAGVQDNKEAEAVSAPVKHGKYSSFLEAEIAQPSVRNSDTESQRINMAFTPSNISLIESLSDNYGINKTFLINSIVRIISKEDVDEFVHNERIVRTRDGIIKGKPAQKRICLRLDGDNYSKISEEANARNQTLTQYVNLLLQIFAHEEAEA